MVLYGITSVRERLVCDPASIRKVFVERSFRHPEIQSLLAQHRIRCDTVSERDLRRITPAKDLQKIVAKVEQFTYLPYEDIFQRSTRPSLVFLDGINDPHNLGVILRTLACYGDFAIVLPEKGTCSINDTVMHVASGGENYVPVMRVPDLTVALATARKEGYVIYGSVVDQDALDITHHAFRFPVALILGAEAQGIHQRTLALADHQIVIPMHGAALSLNVNNACAIICYEISKQRKLSQ